MAITLGLFTLATGLLIVLALIERIKWARSTQGVPAVDRCWPFVGHAFAIAYAPLAFLHDSYRRYGPVFKVKFFGMHFVFIADRSLVHEFFKAPEKVMSFEFRHDRQCFIDAFFDHRPPFASTMMRLLRSTGISQFEQFAPVIMFEASRMVDRLKALDGRQFDVFEESFRFVVRASLRCFMKVDVSEALCDAVRGWVRLVNIALVLSCVVPAQLVRFFLGPSFRSYTRTFAKEMQPIIARYRADTSLNESHMFRTIVDCRGENGKPLGDMEIVQALGALFYASANSTPFGVANALTDAARSQRGWQEVLEATSKHVERAEYHKLLKEGKLDAFVMETARTSTHMFTPQRKPLANVSLGDGRYFLTPSVDAVVLCAPLLMQTEAADGLFENAADYDPTRFLEPRNESTHPADLITWGAGHHSCPGRGIAVYEIKAALALIVNAFECCEIKQQPSLNYNCVSAFAERYPFSLSLRSRNKSDVPILEAH